MAEPAKLPLTVRKNIRDSEAKRDEHLAEINKITGKTYKFTPNFETNQPLIEGWGKENIGDVYHNNLLGQFPKLLKTNLADPLFKEEYEKTVTKDEIVFKVGKVVRDQTGGQSSYMDVYFEDGCLVLTHTPSMSNIDDIGKYNLVKVRGLNQSNAKLPLFVRQNMVANEAKKKEALDKISKATGQTWTFDESCLDAIWEEYTKHADWDRYKETMGTFFLNTGLNNLATNIETMCKDDMVQEGFVEATPNKTIVFRYVNPLPAWWVPKIEDGKLVAQFRDLTNFGHLSSQSNFDITKLL